MLLFGPVNLQQHALLYNGMIKSLISLHDKESRMNVKLDMEYSTNKHKVIGCYL